MRLCRTRAGREDGQVLVISVLFMTVLLGFAALTMDVGRMASAKRQIQNMADAAAQAGAWQLPSAPGVAVTDAENWAGLNETVTGDATNVVVSAFDAANDTISVTVTRPVPYTFGRVVGLTSQTLTATSRMRIQVMEGIDVNNPRLFPYAVWGGNVKQDSGPTKIHDLPVGTTVTYRSNQWDKNVQPIPGCDKSPLENYNWEIKSNDFKGYFHWGNGSSKIYISEDPYTVTNQGGNAMGTQDLARLESYQQSGTPVILPVINLGEDASGKGMQLRIVAFVCVKLDPIGNASSDWTGKITKCSTAGFYDGDTPPPPNVPNATTPTYIKDS